jgi:hypothetical protein
MATRHAIDRLSARIEALAESVERTAPILRLNQSGEAKLIERYPPDRFQRSPSSLGPDVYCMSDQEIERELQEIERKLQPWYRELLADGVLTADDFKR